MDLLRRRPRGAAAVEPGADLFADVSAGARRVAVTVRRRHRAELVRLHRVLFSDAGEWLASNGPAYTPPGIISRAVRDPLARVSVCADVGDLTDVVAAGGLDGPTAPGMVAVHVSVGGHRRFVEGPRRLSPAEEEGWARAVYGPRSEDAAYYGGHSTEIVPTGIAHFFLFLGPHRNPLPAPPGWVGPLRPITGLGPSAAPARATTR